MFYPTYGDLCVATLLRLGEDRSIRDGKVEELNSSVQGYLKAMPQLLREVLAAFNLEQEVADDIADEVEILAEPQVYALFPLYCEAILRKINDEDYAMSALSEFYQRRDELLFLPKARIIAGKWGDL